MKYRTKQVDFKVILIGIGAVFLYLVAFGLCSFVFTAYFMGNIDYYTSIILLAFSLIIINISNKIIDYLFFI